jgi:hypothetical protein
VVIEEFETTASELLQQARKGESRGESGEELCGELGDGVRKAA